MPDTGKKSMEQLCKPPLLSSLKQRRGRSDTKHATPPSKASKRSRLKAAPKGGYEIQKKGLQGFALHVADIGEKFIILVKPDRFNAGGGKPKPFDQPVRGISGVNIGDIRGFPLAVHSEIKTAQLHGTDGQIHFRVLVELCEKLMEPRSKNGWCIGMTIGLGKKRRARLTFQKIAAEHRNQSPVTDSDIFSLIAL